MTNTTLRLIDRLSQLVDQNKYLILSGGIGVGKTYLACAVAENCALPQYNAQEVLLRDAAMRSSQRWSPSIPPIRMRTLSPA